MQELNYVTSLIPKFRLLKTLLDITPITVKGRELRVNPTMTTNLLIMDKHSSKYMSDKLAMLYNSIIRDTTLVITGNGKVGRSYVIKYELGKLSIAFGNSLKLTVTLSKKMVSIINDENYKHNRTNYAVMVYVASAIMNIPKYEYPIPIIDSDMHISTVTIDNVDVLYVHKDALPYPKKIKKLTNEVTSKIRSLRDKGDVLSCAMSLGISNVTRVLSLINYCRYYDTVTPSLIMSLLSGVSVVKLDFDHLDNMIKYMELYRDILVIKEKYIVHIPRKQFK